MAGTRSAQPRSILGPLLLLLTSLAAALASSAARQGGQFTAARLLAGLALLTAAAVGFTLVPRLWRKVRAGRSQLSQLRYFRFTSRGTLFILTALTIAFASLNTGNNLLILILSVMLASLIVSGGFANMALRGLMVTLILPKHIHVDQRVIFYLTLENLKKWMPSCALRIRGRFEPKSLPRRSAQAHLDEMEFPFLRAGEKKRLRLEHGFPERGLYSVDGFLIFTTFPFGFFRRGRKAEVRGQIVVFPALIEIERLFLRLPHLRDGSQEAPVKGPGSSVYNIRNYQSGDRARHVHWKSTAKLGRLMIKDFALEEDQPLHIVFSTALPDATERSRRQFEKAVSWIATLVHHHHSTGKKLSFTSGDFKISVKSSRRDYESLMRFLAGVQPGQCASSPRLDCDERAVVFASGEGAAAGGAYRVDYMRI